MIALVKQLKADGYELGIISNIGERIFQDLEPQHADLFTLFDTIIVASPESNYASKPNPKIYERFLELNNHQAKQMILIDDKQKNLCGALPFSIIGIRFRSYEACKAKLKQLGIEV